MAATAPRRSHLGEIHIFHVRGIVVVVNLAAGPFHALHTEKLAGFLGGCGRDGGVPPVVARHLLFMWRLLVVDGKCQGGGVGRHRASGWGLHAECVGG